MKQGWVRLEPELEDAEGMHGGGGGALSGTTLRHLQGTLFLALPGLLVPEVVSIGNSGDNALLHQQPVRGSTATLTGTLFCFPPIPRLIALT